MTRTLAIALLLAACTPRADHGWLNDYDAPGEVRVCLDEQLAVFYPSLYAAADLWHDAIGSHVIEVTCHEPTVRIRWASYDGTCSMRFVASGEIRIARAVDVRQAYVDLAHELGHVLGLGHDEFGLMQPIGYDPSPWGKEPPLGRYRITDADRARVRERWGR